MFSENVHNCCSFCWDCDAGCFPRTASGSTWRWNILSNIVCICFNHSRRTGTYIMKYINASTVSDMCIPVFMIKNNNLETNELEFVKNKRETTIDEMIVHNRNPFLSTFKVSAFSSKLIGGRGIFESIFSFDKSFINLSCLFLRIWKIHCEDIERRLSLKW